MRTLLRLSLLLAALLLGGCGRAPLQEQQAFVFGTRVEVLVAGGDAEQGRKAIATVLREFDRLHRHFHAWQESELTALNLAIFSGRPQQVSDELAAFIREAQQLSARGDHLFDPGIGRLIAIWGFQSDEFAARLPPAEAITAWRQAKPSIADLTLDGNTVSSRNPQVALDFGGYLKGVALDRAAQLLREQGIRNALINIGGNVMALGSKEGQPWRVGIQHPRQPGPMATVKLADGEAIGTSGDYQRYFEIDGQRYPHLLDPRSGSPAAHTQAVTVLIPAIAQAGTLSDALSKPIFIAGRDAWRQMARQLDAPLVLRVDADGSVQITEALHKRLEFVSKAPAMTVTP